MNILNKLIKKFTGKTNTDREISNEDIQDLKREIEALQRSEARLRQDLREIIREEIKYVLDHRARRVFPL